MSPVALAEAAITAALAEVNADLPPDMRLGTASTIRLSGPEREIDSFGLVTLLAAVEHHVAQLAGIRLDLGDGDMFRDGANPLADLGSLAAHVAQRLDRAQAP